MRFNTTLAATLLVLGVATPAYAEAETLPETALAAERDYVETASACVTQGLPPINELHFPAQIPLPNPMQPSAEPTAATPPTQQSAPACP